MTPTTIQADLSRKLERLKRWIIVFGVTSIIAIPVSHSLGAVFRSETDNERKWRLHRDLDYAVLDLLQIDLKNSKDPRVTQVLNRLKDLVNKIHEPTTGQPNRIGSDVPGE